MLRQRFGILYTRDCVGIFRQIAAHRGSVECEIRIASKEFDQVLFFLRLEGSTGRAVCLNQVSEGRGGKSSFNHAGHGPGFFSIIFPLDTRREANRLVINFLVSQLQPGLSIKLSQVTRRLQ